MKYYAGGLVPLPDPERLRPVLTQLVAALGRPLKRAQIKAWGNGHVFVDRTVHLAPP